MIRLPVPFLITLKRHKRFPAPRHSRDGRATVIREIERQATQAWDSGEPAMAAWDFMRVTIPVAEDMGYGRGFDSGEDESGEIKTEMLEVDFDYRSVSASGSAAWSTATTTTTTTINTERDWEGNRRKKRRP